MSNLISRVKFLTSDEGETILTIKSLVGYINYNLDTTIVTDAIVTDGVLLEVFITYCVNANIDTGFTSFNKWLVDNRLSILTLITNIRKVDNDDNL